jgi:hypothetical protein
MYSNSQIKQEQEGNKSTNVQLFPPVISTTTPISSPS